MKKVYLFNTLTSQKEEFKPLIENEVSIYYCGPTVYNYPHLGNMRTVVVFDLLARLLTELGYNVKMVRNYTDIDDKIINAAIAEGKTEKEISDFYIKSYEDTESKLNCLPLYAKPRVSETMDHIISFIETMIKENVAYKEGDDVYFDVTKDSKYGELSKMKLENLDDGNRVAKNLNKHNAQDFVLWKLTSDNGIKFDAPFGRGRPGWHTECVVMVNDVFKKPIIDIHGGGFDLKFPHHENEMAQSECVNHTTLAKYWMHVGFLNVNGEKMSKSLGNDLKAKDVISMYSGDAVRLFFYSSHYRSPLNFTDDNLKEAVNKVKKYQETIYKLHNKFELENLDYYSHAFLDETFDSFIDSLCDDLNVNNALVSVEKIVKDINQLTRKRDLDVKLLSANYNTLIKCMNLLGITYQLHEVTLQEKELYLQYLNSKLEKDFETSDRLRKELIEKGLI